MTVIDCPVSCCGASLDLIVEQAYPGDDELTTLRIPLHAVVADGAWADLTCPASLIGYPMTAYAGELLADQGAAIARILTDRNRAAQTGAVAAIVAGARGRSAGEHSLTPHPSREPSHWLRSTGGGDPRRLGPTGRSRLQFLPGGRVDPSSRPKGDMSSISEVRAKLTRSNELLTEARQLAHLVSAKLAESLQILADVQESSTSDMGIPAVHGAIQAADSITGMVNRAIDDANIYQGSL